MRNISIHKHNKKGSALLLCIVLTMLLAVIGVTFVAVSRIDDSVTGVISDKKNLDNAIDAIISKINDQLVLDTPGIYSQDDIKNMDKDEKLQLEYYDYPGSNDTWLSSIEPMSLDGVDAVSASGSFDEWRWEQISDPTGYLKNNEIATNIVKLKPSGSNDIAEYPEIEVDEFGRLLGGKNDTSADKDDGEDDDEYTGQLADADGDGIADSKWVELEDFSTTTGQKVYAAIRVIDNGGMVNLNTALGMNLESDLRNMVDGSSLTQIDLAGMIIPSSSQSFDNRMDFLKKLNGYNVSGNLAFGRIGHSTGADTEWWRDTVFNSSTHPWDALLNRFNRESVWRSDYKPDGQYIPFDISDELALRERFCIRGKALSRVELLYEDAADGLNDYTQPYDSSSGDGLNEWLERIASSDRFSQAKFDATHKRHYFTTLSKDRTLSPDGEKPFCLNIDISSEARLLDTRSVGRNSDRSKDTARRLFNVLLKGVCKNKLLDNDGDKISSRDELEDWEIVKLAQLAVNIVDMRDPDTDNITSLNIERFLDDGDWEDWYDPDTDIDPDINLNINEEFVYGWEPHPVISKVAVAFDRLTEYNGRDVEYDDALTSWVYTDVTPNEVVDVDFSSDTTFAGIPHYAVELYNPFDFEIRFENKDYKLLFKDKYENGSEDHYENLPEVRLPETFIKARSVLVVCDDETFWKKFYDASSTETTEVTSEYSIISDSDVVLSSPIKVIDKESGDPGRNLDVRVRIPRHVILEREVYNVDRGVGSTDAPRSRRMHPICIDKQVVSPALVMWDPNNYVVKAYQREMLTSNAQRDNIAWTQSLYPAMSLIKYDSDPDDMPDFPIFGLLKRSGTLRRGLDISLPFVNEKWEKEFGLELDHSNINKGDGSSDDYDLSSNSELSIQFSSVGDITRIWTVGPKLTYDVFNSLKDRDAYYTSNAESIFDQLVDDLPDYDPNLLIDGIYVHDPNDSLGTDDPEDPNAVGGFYTVGEILEYASDRNLSGTGKEQLVRMNIRDPRYSNIFQYLTVFDPARDGINNDGTGVDDPQNSSDHDPDNIEEAWDEFVLSYDHDLRREKTRLMQLTVPGRININTAPWYVIAQLPWMKYDPSSSTSKNEYSDPDQRYALAQAITAYRDKQEVDSISYVGENGRYDEIRSKIKSYMQSSTRERDLIREAKGFASIGEVALVLNGSANSFSDYSMDRLGCDNTDIKGFPDLSVDDTPFPGSTIISGDNCEDDFEEKDMLFSRISNLITVRSDVFTAYITVRLGKKGPQKRVVAIIDRSNVFEPSDKARILAIKEVADTRGNVTGRGAN